MKLYFILVLLFCMHTVHAQGKTYNKSRQVEDLQQLRHNLTRKIDSLQLQLPELAASMENTRKKIDLLKKETNGQDRPDKESKEQLAKLTIELNNATALADSLRKKFDARTAALDKALSLQRELEEKIQALAKENL